MSSDFQKGVHLGLMDGRKEMHNRLLLMFTQWATTYPEPDSPVVDELWGFIEQLRKVKVNE